MSISYAYSILHDFQLAEEAAQEAFVLLFKNIQNLKEPAAFPVWLKKLVFTSCNRIRRKQKPETSIEDASTPLDDNNDPNVVYEKNEQKELVKKNHTINSHLWRV
jgi:RNA polymerase sigma-70 factor (ECF subfamily)